MGGLSERKKRAAMADAAPAPVTEKSVRRQLASAAGTEYFQNRDPIYHLNESFCQSFDLLGQMRARGQEPGTNDALSAFMRDETPGIEGFESRENEGAPGGEQNQELLQKTDMSDKYRPRDSRPENRMMDKFADVSFNRGSLAASVIRGTGKMMLFSCVKRTVGQNEPKQLHERQLFQGHSVHRHIPGHREDMSVVNRGFADSAVGLVVDVLKDSRQALDSLTAMAEGKGGTDEKSGVGTLRKQYPFLTDSREREMLNEYREKLDALRGDENTGERLVLQRAVEKTEALIHKKDQMKRDFLQKLRYLSHCATTASAVFTQEDFRQSLYEELEREEAEPLPPDDGGDASGGKPGEGDGQPRPGGKGESDDLNI